MSGRPYQHIDALNYPRLPIPQTLGEHYWVIQTMHYLSPETARDANSASLDAENLVAISPVRCLACLSPLGTPGRCRGGRMTLRSKTSN